MIKKQVDYVFRLLKYSSVEEGHPTEGWSTWIREVYLAEGYEVLSAEVVKVDANDVFVGIHFVKYEYVEE